MVFVVDDDPVQPQGLLERYRLVLVTQDLVPYLIWPQLYANPSHETALLLAGFVKVSCVMGNALFLARTNDPNCVMAMLALAFDDDFVVCNAKAVPKCIDYTEETLRVAIREKLDQHAHDEMPWCAETLMHALKCVEPALFTMVLHDMWKEGSIRDANGNLEWVVSCLSSY